MANISVSLPSDGDTIDVADYNTPITTIVNEINGGLDNSNISASAAIDGSKIASSSIPSTALSAQQAWVEVGSGGSAPAFENSWVNFSAAYSTCAFMKDSLGFVHLKGMVKSGSVNAVIFTLPTGYRPALINYFPAIANDLFAEIQVHNDGTIKMPVSGSNVYATLNGITFKAV